jgi:hypothetical protein
MKTGRCKEPTKLPKVFWEQLPEKTEEELCAMLADPGDYLPEALTAVRQELESRNLPPQVARHLASVARGEARQNRSKQAVKVANGVLLLHALVWLFHSMLGGCHS